MRFDGEEVKAVALGTGWVAAITSLNFLRIFTEGGLQVCNMGIICVLYMGNNLRCMCTSFSCTFKISAFTA